MNLAPPKEWLVLSAALVQELPKERRWTKKRRDAWLAAYAAAVDLHYDVTDALAGPRLRRTVGAKPDDPTG